MKDKRCAFTGHRPSSYRFGYDEWHPDCQRLKALLREQVMQLIQEGVTTFITGMALGADTWGAEIVLDFKRKNPGLQLFAALPCKTQADGWTLEQKNRYLNILHQCVSVCSMEDVYTRGCMFERNRWMVDHAQYVLAVYNGGATGGTAYTVRYALGKGKSMVAIDPETLTIQNLRTRTL